VLKADVQHSENIKRFIFRTEYNSASGYSESNKRNNLEVLVVDGNSIKDLLLMKIIRLLMNHH